MQVVSACSWPQGMDLGELGLALVSLGVHSHHLIPYRPSFALVASSAAALVRRLRFLSFFLPLFLEEFPKIFSVLSLEIIFLNISVWKYRASRFLGFQGRRR